LVKRVRRVQPAVFAVLGLPLLQLAVALVDDRRQPVDLAAQKADARQVLSQLQAHVLHLRELVLRQLQLLHLLVIGVRYPLALLILIRTCACPSKSSCTSFSLNCSLLRPWHRPRRFSISFSSPEIVYSFSFRLRTHLFIIYETFVTRFWCFKKRCSLLIALHFRCSPGRFRTPISRSTLPDLLCFILVKESRLFSLQAFRGSLELAKLREA